MIAISDFSFSIPRDTNAANEQSLYKLYDVFFKTVHCDNFNVDVSTRSIAHVHPLRAVLAF